jgi:hypothetical protein
LGGTVTPKQAHDRVRDIEREMWGEPWEARAERYKRELLSAYEAGRSDGRAESAHQSPREEPG